MVAESPDETAVTLKEFIFAFLFGFNVINIISVKIAGLWQKYLDQDTRFKFRLYHPHPPVKSCVHCTGNTDD